MTKHMAALAVAFVVQTAVHSAAQESTAVPAERVEWIDSLERGFELARAEDKPLFVTVRCLPCKQCADFDRDVLEGGPELGPLLHRFVTVRLTDAAQIDLRIMPVADFQDLDLSWWGWFLSPSGGIYGVFGGRDEVSDKTRISVAALCTTLRRVLVHHAESDRPAPASSAPDSPRSARDLPGHASWSRRVQNDAKTREANCIHCHQVAEILRQPALDAGTFDKHRDFEIWPLPENVGLSVDRDDGLRVTLVVEDSASARAGIEPGDELVRAGDRRLFSQADLRAVLHRAQRDDAAIEIEWRRTGSIHHGTLRTVAGWKRTALDWRMSVSQGNVGAGPGFWPLAAKPEDRHRFGVEDGDMCVRPWWGQGKDSAPQRAGLRQSDAIVAIDGERPDLIGRAFLVWFRMRKEPGDEVKLTVRDGATEREVVYRIPAETDH